MELDLLLEKLHSQRTEMSRTDLSLSQHLKLYQSYQHDENVAKKKIAEYHQHLNGLSEEIDTVWKNGLNALETEELNPIDKISPENSLPHLTWLTPTPDTTTTTPPTPPNPDTSTSTTHDTTSQEDPIKRMEEILATLQASQSLQLSCQQVTDMTREYLKVVSLIPTIKSLSSTTLSKET